MIPSNCPTVLSMSLSHTQAGIWKMAGQKFCHCSWSVGMWTHPEWWLKHPCPQPSSLQCCSLWHWPCGSSTSLCQSLQFMLMESAHDNANCASLLAAATKKSGTWLHAILNTALVLKLDDSALRIAIGLRLGTTVCVAHHSALWRRWKQPRYPRFELP